ncbi:MerR family transcriptional regulator [Actinokineospora sp. G85]|uniref:MerR family transcriptional regulator n=1 Tax=Actinokineospora sp. G85 TaxID=3406626 RepID=UPI003C757CBB
MDEEERWSVGDLAKSAGLTVRTLHHYDEIGLVSPSERTPAGHRRYTPADVRTLYRVRALRSLGLGLDTIAETLTVPTDLSDVLRTQLIHLDAELDRTKALRARVSALLDHETTLDLLEAMHMIEQYYTPEQLEYLARRRSELGEDRIKAVEAEWPGIIERMTAHHKAGTDPADPDVQALATRWSELMAEFHGGDQSIIDSARRMLTDTEAEGKQESNGFNKELFAYVQRAWDAK